MTRRILLLFAFSLGFIFSVLIALFGQGGYLHNRALKAEIERLSYEQTVLSLQVDSLKRQREEASSVDALKDAAFKYGYQTEGEQVYFFSIEDAEAPENEVRENGSLSQDQERPFRGISVIWIALISLVIALLITVCYGWMQKRRRRDSHELDG
ncbi:MAG: FtsB family cell division protein [Sphaerochaetaceae bacterium]